MSVTLGDLQTSLAYRMGENSSPNDSNETARRKSFINEAYRAVMTKFYWWFTESTATFSSVANQESYGTSDGVPTNVRAILELRFQSTRYNQITQTEAMSSYTTPYNGVYNSYFIFNQKIYPVPTFSSTVSNGVTLKYYASYTPLSATTDTVLIPDMYTDILVAYAYARVNMVKGKRGSASDGFDEYTELLGKMSEEQNRYQFSLKGDDVGGTLESIFT